MLPRTQKHSLSFTQSVGSSYICSDKRIADVRLAFQTSHHQTGLQATKTETVKSSNRPRHASSHTHITHWIHSKHTWARPPTLTTEVTLEYNKKWLRLNELMCCCHVYMDMSSVWTCPLIKRWFINQQQRRSTLFSEMFNGFSDDLSLCVGIKC